MLNLLFFKKHTDEELSRFIDETRDDLARALRQTDALKRTQEARPGFHNFNPIAGDYLTIGEYIEFSLAIQADIRDDLALLTKEVDKRRGLNQTIKMF